MIPKIIHLCWLSGDPYPRQIKKCIDSWKKYLPDYEIWLWDKNRFDVNSVDWVREAYGEKKYAFCADYIRLYALYNYGGIYLDSDVEVIKSFNDLIELPFFIGYEYQGYFEAAVIGSEQGNPFIGRLLKAYNEDHFVKNGKLDYEVMPKKMMRLCDESYERRLICSISDYNANDMNTIHVFPFDWFSPIDASGSYNQLKLSKNTYCIHHFANAWLGNEMRILNRLLGRNTKINKLAYFCVVWLLTQYHTVKRHFKFSQ